MLPRLFTTKTGKLLFLFGVVLTAALLVSSPGPGYSVHSKAAYLDPNTANFVRPGLVIKITSAAIADDGTITTRFKLTDPKGLPIDKDGIQTPGVVSLGMVAAYIPKGQTQYVAYTTRIETSPITNKSATQASADSGGVFTKNADGDYTYTFKTKAASGFDKTATHTIGIYGNRNLSEFDLGIQKTDNTFDFVPDGSQVTQVREVALTSSCNKCHNPLSAHGETGRTSVPMCILCHTPQTTDADTGNTVDFPVMIHKIHDGANLPSVKAGTPYQIIGFAQSVNDFSTVVFPADVRNCTACHSPTAKQNTAYFKPNRAACGACHDDVNFATGDKHVNLPQVSDNQCSQCHTPQGELEFDASILGAHTIPRFSRDLQGLVVDIVSVENAVSGKAPTVTFTAKNKAGSPVAMSDIARLGITWAGPTTDYGTVVQEDGTKATGSNGTYTYTFTQPIPADAKGTYTIELEGYRNGVLLAGTTKQMTVRDAVVNKVMNVSVDGTPIAPRRQIVSLDKCNNCHSSLSLHGDNRNRIEACVLCHNPNGNDAARRPASAGPPQTIDFRTMIHKIHTGETLTGEMTIYGFGGSKNDFTDVRFPGDRRDCSTCHVNNSQQLPLKDNLLPVQDARGVVNPVMPTAAACRGCHDDLATASHTVSNTNNLGESCAVCHGPTADFSVDKEHAR